MVYESLVSVCLTTNNLIISGVYTCEKFFNNIPYKHMCLTSKINLAKRFSEKYKCMRLLTRLYGIRFQKLNPIQDSIRAFCHYNAWFMIFQNPL